VIINICKSVFGELETPSYTSRSFLIGNWISHGWRIVDCGNIYRSNALVKSLASTCTRITIIIKINFNRSRPISREILIRSEIDIARLMDVIVKIYQNPCEGQAIGEVTMYRHSSTRSHIENPSVCDQDQTQVATSRIDISD